MRKEPDTCHSTVVQQGWARRLGRVREDLQPHTAVVGKPWCSCCTGSTQEELAGCPGAGDVDLVCMGSSGRFWAAAEVGKALWRSPGPTPAQVAQDHDQAALENLPGG